MTHYCIRCDGLTTVTTCKPSQILLTGHKVISNQTYNVSVCKSEEECKDEGVLRDCTHQA